MRGSGRWFQSLFGILLAVGLAEAIGVSRQSINGSNP